MPFELKNVVPWGRSLTEYQDMFCLTADDLPKKIAGFGDGPASFNAEWTQKGGYAISFDPIYHYPAEALRQQFASVRAIVLQQTRENLQHYVWKRYKNLDALEQARESAMNRFLADYEAGLAAKRYIPLELPEKAPFADESFDLGLCSHFLLLYTQMGYDFHIRAIDEMLRLCDEVRIFPLLDLNGLESDLPGKVIDHYSSGFSVAVVPARYEFLKGADRMLSIRHR